MTVTMVSTITCRFKNVDLVASTEYLCGKAKNVCQNIWVFVCELRHR